MKQLIQFINRRRQSCVFFPDYLVSTERWDGGEGEFKFQMYGLAEKCFHYSFPSISHYSITEVDLQQSSSLLQLLHGSRVMWGNL